MGKYKIVSFIPARGGSERIPRKNIKMLAGKPMIAWTIEASLKSKYIDRTFVSTEDKEIKEVALKYGAEVIDRPPELSQGQIVIAFAYSHFQYCLWEEKYQPDYTIMLLPTSPLRIAKHIDEAFELYFNSEETLLMSFTESRTLPTNAFLINGAGRLEYLLKGDTREALVEKFGDRHIKNPTMYYIDSAIQIGPFNEVNYFNIDNTISLLDYIIPYVMRPEDTIDVDTPFDFKVAEMLLGERIKEGLVKINNLEYLT